MSSVEELNKLLEVSTRRKHPSVNFVHPQRLHEDNIFRGVSSKLVVSLWPKHTFQQVIKHSAQSNS